eukprot:751095-Hanusia_phi.AAC.2
MSKLLTLLSKNILQHVKQSNPSAEPTAAPSGSLQDTKSDRALKEISINKPAPSGAKPRKNKNRDVVDGEERITTLGSGSDAPEYGRWTVQEVQDML